MRCSPRRTRREGGLETVGRRGEGRRLHNCRRAAHLVREEQREGLLQGPARFCSLNGMLVLCSVFKGVLASLTVEIH